MLISFLLFCFYTFHSQHRVNSSLHYQKSNTVGWDDEGRGFGHGEGVVGEREELLGGNDKIAGVNKAG